MFLCKEMPFGDHDKVAPHLWGIIPQNLHFLVLGHEWAFSSQTCYISTLTYYRNYCIDCNKILYSDKDCQVLFVGCLNMLITNPRWRTAAILTNRKIAISVQRFDSLPKKFCTMMHIDSLNHTCSLKIDFLKIQDGRRPPF